MKVNWSKRAFNNYEKTLAFWEENNGNSIYSEQIENETNRLIAEISNPECIYFGRYSKELKLYIRSILSGRIQIYFSINEEKQIIQIKHFKGAKQKPIY